MSRAVDAAAGHYLSYVDPQTRELTTLAVHGFAEQLDVYVDEDGRCGPSTPSRSSGSRSSSSTTGSIASTGADVRAVACPVDASGGPV